MQIQGRDVDLSCSAGQHPFGFSDFTSTFQIFRFSLSAKLPIKVFILWQIPRNGVVNKYPHSCSSPSPQTPRRWGHGQTKVDFKFQPPSHPVTLSGTALLLERHTKQMGVTVNPHFTFYIHARVLKKYTAKRPKILRKLVGTNRGQ